jgi:Heparinase II/III-like protein/Heparinase II/III N-terminus
MHTSKNRVKLISTPEFESLFNTQNRFQCSEDFFEFVSSREWIFASKSKLEILAYLKEHLPKRNKEVIGRAEQVHENCFDIHGSNPTYLGAKIDWHLDFKSGRKWNKEFFLNVPTMFWGDSSDAKIPWEMSRFHYLADLAIAYNLTSMKKYLQKYVSLIENWIYENPCPYGINWANSMEASIRAINWLSSYELIDSKLFTSDFKLKFFHTLYQHGIYIWENLAGYGPGTNNNHHIIDLLGLLVLGRLFLDLPDGRTWHEYACSELESEIFKQISPDGTCYESSLNYQISIVELYLLAIHFESRFNHHFSDELKARLMQSCGALYLLCKPDNTVPNFGDSGSDRLFKLCNRNERDLRYILDLAAVIIDLKGYNSTNIGPEPEMLWWTGLQSIDKFFDNTINYSRPKESLYFADSGLAVMRNKHSYLGFFANSVSEMGFGGHKHNDLLSFEFSYGNENFIVDSGTYVYTGDPSGRNYFRKTGSHSTLEVDGQEVNRFLPKILFSIRKDAEIKEVYWESNSSQDIISADHSGYTRLDNPVIVRRTVHFNKSDSIYIFKDQFLGSGKHLFNGNLILNAHIKAGIFDNQIILMTPSGKLSVLIFTQPEWHLEKIPHYISKRYGCKTESWKIRYSLIDKAPRSCIWGLFGLDCLSDLNDKINIFNQILKSIGWCPSTFNKLILKRGQEIAIPEVELRKLFSPGIDELENEPA